jgi:DNA polymerase I-like protein with 3'-5' exonuclease and polymerase domains
MRHLVLDIETNKAHSHIHMAVTTDIDTDEIVCHRNAESLRKVLTDPAMLIMHNGISFDSYLCNKLWKTQITLAQSIDTLNLSRLLKPDLNGGHSLDAWGQRLGVAKSNFTDFDEPAVGETVEDWLDRMETYCVQDTKVTAKLYRYLMEQLKAKGFSQDCRTLEFEYQDIIAKQERKGWLFNQKDAMLLRSKLLGEQDAIVDHMQQVFAPTVTVLKKRNYANKGYYTKETLHEGLLSAALRAVEESFPDGVRKQQGQGNSEEKRQIQRKSVEGKGHDSERNLRDNLGAVQPTPVGTKRKVSNLLSSANKESVGGGSRSQDGKDSGSSVFSMQHGTRKGTGFDRNSPEYDCLSNYLFKLTPFNPGSRQQIADRLVKRGWKPKEKTESGQITVNEDTLESCPVPEAKLISRYMMLVKRTSQLDQWINAAEKDGRVHGKVITNGAVSSRCTHHSPNIAQVPTVHKEYGKECRGLFHVPKGYSQVGADASGLELRMLAHYMRDPDYVKTVTEGKSSLGTDIHTVNQKAAGLATRDQAKTFIYALLYGAGPGKIGSIVGGSAKEGHKLIDSFMRNLPALDELRKKVAKYAAKGYVPGLDGRKIWVRSEHSALNTLLQGNGAICLKRAKVICNGYLVSNGLDDVFVGDIHDEWQMEVVSERAEMAGEIAVRSIREAGIYFGLSCPLDGEYKIGSNWAETH